MNYEYERDTRYTDEIVASDVRLINLTEHDIRVGEDIDLPKATMKARVFNDREFDGLLVMGSQKDGIPIYRFKTTGRIEGLPDPKDGVVYIVDPHVRRFLTQQGMERPDVVSPYVLKKRVIGDRRVTCTMALAR